MVGMWKTSVMHSVFRRTAAIAGAASRDVNKPLSPLKGPTRITTRALLTAIEDLFTEDSDFFLDEVCTWLTFEHQITISTSALSRSLTQAGLTRKVLRKLACERDEVRREEFRAGLQNDFIG
jgi:transposase